VRVITFAHRDQGLIVAPGNPLGVTSLDDLPRVRYVNRQRGAGTRVLLDYELERRGTEPTQVEGYEREEYTHLAVAAAVASGRADCGLGIRAAAEALGLGFVPLFQELYQLAMPEDVLPQRSVQYLLDHLNRSSFRRRVSHLAGYDTTHTGELLAVP